MTHFKLMSSKSTPLTN